jgi:hypothetical protein
MVGVMPDNDVLPSLHSPPKSGRSNRRNIVTPRGYDAKLCCGFVRCASRGHITDEYMGPRVTDECNQIYSSVPHH